MPDNNDPLDDIRALMKDPQKEMREIRELLKDPTGGIRELKAIISGPTQALANVRNAFTNYRLDQRFAELNSWQRSNPYSEYLEATKIRPLALLEAQKALFSRIDDVSHFAQSVVKLQSIAKQFQAQNRLTLESHREHIAALTLEAQNLLSPHARGALTLAEQLTHLVDKDSIAAIMRMGQQSSFALDAIQDNEPLFDEALPSTRESISGDPISKLSIQEFEGAITHAIRNAKDPLLKLTLIYVLLPLLVNMLWLFASPHIAPSAVPRTQTKEIKTQVTTAVTHKDLLSTMRIVSANSLNVRTDASIKSDIAGELPFGALVMVIEKRRNWTLVEWSDPHGKARIRGWVFTRYIKPLR